MRVRSPTQKEPGAEIACQTFKSGVWWWASVEPRDGGCITSDYCRTRAAAIRRLKRKIKRLGEDLEVAKGFLGMR